MCLNEKCKAICIYELDEYGTKVYIHYDKCFTPLWIEYVKNGDSLGEYYRKKPKQPK